MLDKQLAPLLHFLGRAMFWRRHAPAPDATDADIAATLPPPEALPNAQSLAPPPERPTSTPEPPPQSPPESPPESKDVGPGRPGWIARGFHRLAVWRRRPATDDAPPAAEPERRPPPPPASEDETEARRPPLGKRLLPILTKKAVWLPAAAVLMAALGAVLSALIMRGQQGDQEQALRTLRAEKLKLEQENQNLRAQPAIIPARAATQAPAARPPDDSAHEAGDLLPQPERTADAAGDGADCIVTGKDGVGDSLRRCIEMYNRAAGR